MAEMYVSRNHDGSQDARMQEMSERRDRCERIAAKLRAMSFDVKWERVNRHYLVFIRWDEGRLATGHLIKQTGIRRIRK